MFIEAEKGNETSREARFGRADRHKRRNAHSGGTTPPPETQELPQAEVIVTPESTPVELGAVEVQAVSALPAAAPDDLAVLRAELAAERRSRAWLEGRLEELDQRLRRAQASERASQNAAAHDQVAVLGFQASLTADSVRAADREALSLWVLEAQLHADAAESAQAIAYRQEPIHVIAEPVTDARLNEKLATARIAIEAAEARSAHNAAQVRRLTEELVSARVEQTRTMNRLRDLEKKLQGLEMRADLLDSIVTDRNPPSGTRDLDLPSESIAVLNPERPSLVFTETEDGPQLAREAEAPTDDNGPGLSLEDFEPIRRAAPAASNTIAALFGDAPAVAEPSTEPTAPSARANDLVDALSEFFGTDAPAAPLVAPLPEERSPVSVGIASLDDEPVSGPPRAMQHDDPLAEALALWGQGLSIPIDVPGVTDKLPETPARATIGDDPFDGLAAALGELERPAAARLAATDDTATPPSRAREEFNSFLDDAPESVDLDDDPYRALAATHEPRLDPPVVESPHSFLDDGPLDDEEEAVAPVKELVEEEAIEEEIEAIEEEPTIAPAPSQPGILAARGEAISTSLFDAVHRVEQERRQAAAAPRPHLAELQRERKHEAAEDEDSDPKPDKKGRAHMVDALMRFMGPQ